MPSLDCSIRPFRPGFFSDDLDAWVYLWNTSATETHGFFPLSAATFRSRMLAEARFRPERLLLATIAGEAVGFLHFDIVDEPPYEPAGVIEAVAVTPRLRRAGIASALLHAALQPLDREGPPLIDALGCWPYSPFYTTLIDGSERSGPWEDDEGMIRLFDRAGFGIAERSRMMRLDLHTLPTPPDLPPWVQLERHPRSSGQTWLDFVFRGWTLVEQIIKTHRGEEITRAIFARMEGLSDFQQRELYALFGIYTPVRYRRQGWARTNLLHLFSYLREKGGEEVEIHVLDSNHAAIDLYHQLGFQTLRKTVALRRRRRRG